MSKPHVCTEPGCQARFARPHRLEAHLRKHRGERPFTCDEENCSKSYTNQSHLRRHKKTAHAETAAPTLRCTVEGCYQIVSNRTNLLRHIKRKHAVQKEHVCEECDAQFHKKHQLRSHMYQHTGVAPYTCEYCPSMFVFITDYRLHRSKHKTYTCKCGEVFHRWTVFRKHMREKCATKVSYTCSTCDKQYGHKTHYTKHLQTHSENREALECPYENCTRLYFYKSNLSQHMKEFHVNERPQAKRVAKKAKPKPGRKAVRATRKDQGRLKKSTALLLTGLAVPYAAEKSVLTGEQIEAENVSDFVASSDFSDVEVRISIIADGQRGPEAAGGTKESEEEIVSAE